MKAYILRFLRACKWFLAGIFATVGIVCTITSALIGGDLYLGKLVRRKEEDHKGDFEHLKARYSDSNENENVELGFH